jgi:anthranilate phosphoribosyltransferase
MSNEFREFLKKVGSGSHTSKNLSREDAAAAMRMMLEQEATPAQIGAFLIAHRIKRPTGEELAGMLDAYAALGPHLEPIADRVIVLGCPYDGRSRTAPVTPITALILAAAGVPVLMHGGDRMGTKYGIPAIEIWQGLGVDWRNTTLARSQQILSTTGLGFVYLPRDFPLAAGLVPYRDQIGKRPPIASLELMWSPYAGNVHVVAGFVHPPTEVFFREAFALRQQAHYTTVKGLEGSCDLPRARTAIIGLSDPNPQAAASAEEALAWGRLHLHARDYGFAARDVPLESEAQLIADLQDVVQGKSSELQQSALWNGGFYLWRCGASADLAAGISRAEMLLTQGTVAQKLQDLRMKL